MATDYKTTDEKPQHDINREVAKLLALSSDKIDKNEYVTVKQYYLLIKVA